MRIVKYFHLVLIFIISLFSYATVSNAENKIITNKVLSNIAPDQNPPEPKVKPPSLELEKIGEEIPDWIARWELARVLSYIKKYDESLVQYKKLIKEKPELYEAKVEMANVLFWSGDEQGSINILGDVPLNKLNDEAKLLIADIYAIQKQYGKAESLYREHLDNNPVDYEVMAKLAEILSWAKNFEASLIEYKKILKAKPDDIQIRRKYAFVLIWTGRHQDAATELKKTLK